MKKAIISFKNEKTGVSTKRRNNSLTNSFLYEQLYITLQQPPYNEHPVKGHIRWLF